MSLPDQAPALSKFAPSKGDLELESVEDKVALEPPSSTPPELTFPDGGLRAWLIVVAGFCVSFATYGLASAFGVFQIVLHDDVLQGSASNSAVGWVGSLQIWGITGVGAFSGKLFDAGYCVHLQIVGSALLVFSLFMTSLCTKLWQLVLAQGVGIGLGMGLIMVPSVACVGHYFRRRRAFALGIIASGSSIGGIVLPLQLRSMFKTSGFGWAVRTSAFIIFALLVVSSCLLRSRLPPKKGGPILDYTVLRNDWPLVFLTLSAFCSQFGLWLPVYFGPRYAVDNGVDPDLAFYSLSILAAGSFFGRVLPNLAADYIGACNTVSASCFASGLLIFCWTSCKTTPSIIAFMAIYGFVQGAFVSAMPASVASLTDDFTRIGARTGITFFAASWSSLASGPVMGALVVRSYNQAAAFCGIMLFLSGIACQTARVLKTRQRHTWRI